MGQLKIILNQQENLTIFDGQPGAFIDVGSAESYSAQIDVTVIGADPAVILAGVGASAPVQDLSYAVIIRGTNGNSYTIQYLNDTLLSPTVSRSGNDIKVHMNATAITGSTATAIKAAIDASPLVNTEITATVTGTGSNVQTATSVTAFSGGVDSGVDISNDSFNEGMSAVGLVTGTEGQFTSTGTLPTGVTTSTNYYVIALDNSTFQVATSRDNANAGIPINITTQGSSNSSITFTATAISGASVQLYESNNNDAPHPIGSPVAITTDTKVWLEQSKPTSRFLVIGYFLDAGAMAVTSDIIVKGYQ